VDGYPIDSHEVEAELRELIELKEPESVDNGVSGESNVLDDDQLRKGSSES